MPRTLILLALLTLAGCCRPAVATALDWDGTHTRLEVEGEIWWITRHLEPGNHDVLLCDNNEIFLEE